MNIGALLFAVIAGVVLFFAGSSAYAVILGVLGGSGLLANSASYLAYGPLAGLGAGLVGAGKALGWAT